MGREGFIPNHKDGLSFYTIPAFIETGLVHHGFSSRLGGVSTGECRSLNLGFKRRDKREAVIENFNRFCQALEISPESMVSTDQVHRDCIAIVGEADKGKGFSLQSDILRTDGLVTVDPDVALVTFYADCVPLFFLDPVQKVIALSHSGWRGTVDKIGKKTLELMQAQYNTNPQDLLVGIGPSIGPCCFEVDTPVADAFRTAFSGSDSKLMKVKGHKAHIDLWEANRIQLVEGGILDWNISIAGICTSCRNDIFFSHRKEAGRTGSMAAILMLKNSIKI